MSKEKKQTKKALVKHRPDPSLATSLDLYLADVRKFPILTKDEEYALALQYWKTGDPRAAHKLVTANLRFVVKIAMRYTKYGVTLKDLIQEGNMGLMMAVKRYNPNLGYRLLSYAVWWIRANIQKHLLDSWSVVRMGTTQAQRKLFSSMKRAQSKLRALEGVEPTDKMLADELDVREKDVFEMRARLAGHDISLDAPVGADEGVARVELLANGQERIDDLLVRKSDEELVQAAVRNLNKEINAKEKMILEKRLLNDEPETLQEIGGKLSISRERVRQLEERLKKKLKTKIEKIIKDGVLPPE